jgi:phosphoribosyl-ATP pyrophosphohydrolase
MVARLAKSLNNDRRHVVPATCATNEDFEALWAADARAARIAPTEGVVEPVVNELDRLYATLADVRLEDHPRTAKLLASGTRKVAQKVIEEAGEVALAAVKHDGRGIVRESADLLYHLAVLWRRAGIDPNDVWGEMRRRADNLGIAEKLPKAKG